LRELTGYIITVYILLLCSFKKMTARKF